MKNTKLLGLLLWVMGLTIPLLLLFVLPNHLNGTVWTVAGCTVAVYVGNLALWLVLQKGKLDFHNLPALTASVAALVLQTVWVIIVSFTSEAIPAKVAVLANVLFIIVQFIVVVLALISKNHIEKGYRRQKNHHTEL